MKQFLIMMFLFVCLATSGADAPKPTGVLGSEFIFETEPKPSCHASTLAETQTALVAAWFAGAKEGAPDVGIWSARCVSGKWSEPVEVADGIQPDGKRWPCWNPVLFQASAGPLMLFYKVGPSPSTWWGMLKTSADEGRTWSDAKRLPDGILGPIKNKPVQLANGEILCPTSTETNGWRVHFETTSDFGATWKSAAPPADSGGPNGKAINGIQPSILLLPNGVLKSVGRTREGKIFETTSTDSGKSWSPLTLTALPNPNSGTDAVTLKDGSHVLIYNHTPKGRSPLNVAISKDGKEWLAALILESDPGEYSYPCVIQTRDGNVNVAYTWRRTKIKHVIIDLKCFEPKPFVDSNWPK